VLIKPVELIEMVQDEYCTPMFTKVLAIVTVIEEGWVGVTKAAHLKEVPS
jgi:hypothetical protein